MSSRPVIVLCPHFAPDTAPTGVIMTRIVEELVAKGHAVHVVTSLPWYRQHRVEATWAGCLWRHEETGWGSITRVTPFAGKDKANIPRRAAGFFGFSFLLGVRGIFAGGVGRKAEAVIALSPPLTLGLTGWFVAKIRRAPLIFNVQDVFPDAAITTGQLSNSKIIALAKWLEKISYQSSDAVVVLSRDLQENVRAKLARPRASKVHVIANFVDSESIVPRSSATAYRDAHGAGAEKVVMYAGNVGFSQSVELVVEAARQLPDVAFIVNGEGSERLAREKEAKGLSNIRFVDYQSVDQLGEVLASADLHVVPLRAGLGSVSVPSKAYSIMAASRPILAAIDAESEVARMVTNVGCGRVVAPDDPNVFVASIREMLEDPTELVAMGSRGREWVMANASPQAAGEAYHRLILSLNNA